MTKLLPYSYGVIVWLHLQTSIKEKQCFHSKSYSEVMSHSFLSFTEMSKNWVTVYQFTCNNEVITYFNINFTL